MYCSKSCSCLGNISQYDREKPKKVSDFAKKSIWTSQELDALVKYYPDMGAKATDMIPNKTISQIRNKASKMGIKVTPEAKYRIVHEAARAYMISNNPMRRPEVAAAASIRAKTTETGKRVFAKMMEGHQKMQKDRPSKLEYRLRQILDELGVSYEPSYMLKHKLIVDVKIGDLIIQADGEYWHGHDRFQPLTDRQIKQKKRDASQDACARSLGFSVERVWDRDVNRDNIKRILAKYSLIEN